MFSCIKRWVVSLDKNFFHFVIQAEIVEDVPEVIGEFKVRKEGSVVEEEMVETATIRKPKEQVPEFVEEAKESAVITRPKRKRQFNFLLLFVEHSVNNRCFFYVLGKFLFFFFALHYFAR